MKASASGQVGVTHQLLKAGANVFQTDKSGRTALDWARLARQGHISRILEAHVVKSIEKRRIARYRSERLVELRRVVERNRKARDEICKIVADNDMVALWNALDRLSGTVGKEAYAEAKEKLGIAQSGGSGVVGTNLDDFYYVDVENHGWTPLTRAAANGDEACVEKLLDEGCEVRRIAKIL